MNCLFFDIASHNGLLACVEDNSILSECEVHDRIRDHDLIPLLEQCLQEAKWRYEDLTHIACTIGPGGFTSLRVGVSLANTLVDQLGIPAAGIHLSNLFEARVGNADFLWLHTTKKEALFIRGFGKFGSRWPEPSLISLDRASADIPDDAHWVGELLPHQEEILHLSPVEAKPLQEVLPSYLNGLTYENKPLFPWYGR